MYAQKFYLINFYKLYFSLTNNLEIGTEAWRHQSEEMEILIKVNITSGDRTHNQSVLQSLFVPLRHDWPQR